VHLLNSQNIITGNLVFVKGENKKSNIHKKINVCPQIAKNAKIRPHLPLGRSSSDYNEIR